MIYKIFSIYDSKAECYDRPIFARSTAEIVRDLTQIVNTTNENNKFYLYPADFTLFEIGEYDDQTSKFNLLDTKHSIVVLHELVSNPIQASS